MKTLDNQNQNGAEKALTSLAAFTQQYQRLEAGGLGWANHLIGLHEAKVALVTGGSGGIGSQIARVLAVSGAKVMLAARRTAQLSEVQAAIIKELESIGYADPAARVQIQPECDISDPNQVTRLVTHTLELFGQVDYLVNNAAVSGGEAMVMDLPLEIWRQTLDANLNSNYALLRLLAPQMKARNSGFVVNVSSYFGGEKYVAIAYPNRADYAVSKAGQRAMVETLARSLGPEIQITAIAPGPVDGERLRGSSARPGMFSRRARVILDNKRLNDVYTLLVKLQRTPEQTVTELLPTLLVNDVPAVMQDPRQPEALRQLATVIWEQSDPAGSSRSHFLNESLAHKLMGRLKKGGYLPTTSAASQPESVQPILAVAPPDPFFSPAEYEREGQGVQSRNLGMLYLKKMPTDLDLAITLAYQLADHNVTGETFYSSGGLRVERAVTEGELFGKAGHERLEKLQGTTIYLVGEYLQQHLTRLAQTFLDEYAVQRIVFLTHSPEAAQTLLEALPVHYRGERVVALATEGQLEVGFDRARQLYGPPVAIISTPFQPLPTCRLTGSSTGDWSQVLSPADFAGMVEQHITHHFRIAQKAAFLDAVRLVLVTPATDTHSSDEEFALANFIKTTLHAFTATLGAESERSVHYGAVNQVDLTRRARDEEPRNPSEAEEELTRFVNAVLLTSAPLPNPQESRYRSRIYRGNAITV